MADTFKTKKWVAYTFFGWCIGVLLILALAVMFDAVGIEHMQFFIALGIGLGVGFMQLQVLKKSTAITGQWLLQTVIGLGTPFLFFDLLRILGDVSLKEYYLPVCIVIGGIIVSLLQYKVLHKNYKNAALWIAGSNLAWLLASAAVLSINYTKYLSSNNWVLFSLNLILIFGGGVVLGWVSGLFLQKIIKTN